jgi:hypothetical protein
MISSRAKSVVVAFVALSLVALNIVVFTRTTEYTCPSGEKYTVENKSRGFPLSYSSSTKVDMNAPECEFSSLPNSISSFGLPALLVNIIVAGAVLTGAHVVLDYKRGKK